MIEDLPSKTLALVPSTRIKRREKEGKEEEEKEGE